MNPKFQFLDLTVVRQASRVSKGCLVSYDYERNIKIYLSCQDSNPNPVSINTYDIIQHM